MRAIVLGAAAGGGFPQWNCKCAVCALAWAADSRVRPATQSSVAVSGDGESWILLNASPDIVKQIGSTPALQPQHAGRHSPIAGVVLTNGDIDHIAGLLSLREGHRFSICALAPVQRMVADNPVFAALSSARFVEVRPTESFSLAGLTIELFAVPGKVPLYLEGDAPVIGSEAGETAGIAVRDRSGTLIYVPGCAAVTREVEVRLRDADAVLFDGTLFTDDEMIRAGLGVKTGRRMGHVPMTGEGGSLDVLTALGARHKVYVHINNTNPVWIEGSPERLMVESAGVAIGHDGMEIVM